VDRNRSIRFETKSGQLGASRSGGWIELDFPQEPPQEAPLPDGLLDALGTEALWIGKDRFDYLVEIGLEETLRGLQPDFNKLGKVTARGIIVTSRSGKSEYDFVSRFFAPAVGINEDPVTGSAYCCLGPYWKEKTGRAEMTVYRASEHGGVIMVRVTGERVRLGGKAVTVWKSDIL